MIYITGAGCGDFRLLTLQAKHVIEQADCILYDRLLDPQILQFAKSSCECIYVGKRNHHHALKQEQINALLVEKARRYPIVVRLKGGDPYVFGRGSEEALYIQEQGLEFEIIPGVTSAIAGCAYAGIPVTHRGMALGVRIMSAHTKEDEMAALDFVSMANSQDTLVFLMGLANIKHIVEGLLHAGKKEHTPVAILSNAARYNQCCVYATLATILQQDLSCIVSPAIIVVGEVISYHSKLNFFEKKPLHGSRYLCAAIQHEEALQWQFHGQGAVLESIACGMMKRNEQAFDQAMLTKCSHVVFTSRYTVRCFFEQLFALKLDARALSHITLCAIGKKSAQALQDYGCSCDLVSPVADSEHLAVYLRKHLQPRDVVLIAKADNDRHILKDALSSLCTVHEIAMYKTMERNFVLEEHPLDGILFTCSFCVHAIMKKITNWAHFKEIPMYAIGEPTRRTLAAYGCQTIITLKHADRETFLDAICKEEAIHVSR